MDQELNLQRLSAVQARRTPAAIRDLNAFMNEWAAWVQSTNLTRPRKMALVLWNLLDQHERKSCALGLCSRSKAILYVKDETAFQEIRGRLNDRVRSELKKATGVQVVLLKPGLGGRPLSDWCSDFL